MKYKAYVLVLLPFITITNCNNNKLRNVDNNEDLPEKTIQISLSDITKDEIGDFLVLDSYIILSNDEIIGEIGRIIIDNEMIFLFDRSQMIIFCYGMDGNMIYKIDRHGQGPTDYVHIEDFGIDPVSGRLFIYDDFKRKILVLDKLTGNHISDFPVLYAAPHKFGVINGSFFFNMDNDIRMVDKKKHKGYNLLFSETGKQIDKSFLRQDAAASYNCCGGFRGHPFFYNNSKLLYNRSFNYRIYHLKKTDLRLLYEVHLPNQLPMKMINKKMDIRELFRSDYSHSLDEIYATKQVLHFVFFKNGFIHTCFYDLDSEKILFCGIDVFANSRKNLPFYYLISGVYNDKFYALIPSFEIESRRESNPAVFPEDLQNVKSEDNYIIAFYKIVH